MPSVYISAQKGNAFRIVNTTTLNASHSETLNIKHNEPFSLEMWVNLSVGASVQILNKNGLSINLNPQGRLWVRLISQNGDGKVDSVTFTPNITGYNLKWRHLVFTYSGVYGSLAAYKLYLDNTLMTVFASDFTNALVSTSDITGTGQMVLGGNVFEGWIASLRLYKSELSSDQVSKGYKNEGAIAVAPNLLAEYLFEDGSATSAADTSGNGNHLTKAGSGTTLNQDTLTI